MYTSKAEALAYSRKYYKEHFEDYYVINAIQD